MSAFPVRPLATVLFCCLLGGTAAASDVREPIRLMPTAEPPSGRPVPGGPPPIGRTGAVGGGSSAIRSDRVDFGNTLWRGSSRATVAALLRSLPSGIQSPALRGLVLRLLTAPAPPPEGGGPSLGPLQMERLLAMGRAGEAQRLADAVGDGADTTAFRRADVEAALTAGDLDRACGSASALVGEGAGSELIPVMAFCLARRGEPERAFILADVLRERGEGDPLFEALLLRVGGAADAPLPKDGPATPANIAMLRHVGASAPKAWRDRNDPAVRALRTGPDGIAEAEKAARNGELAPEALMERYAGAPGEGGRPALVRALRAAREPMGIRTALLALWDSARAAGLLAPVAQATIGRAELLPPEVAATDRLPLMVGAALAAARFDLALQWYERAAAASLVGARREDLRPAWPVLRLADAAVVLPEWPGGRTAWLAGVDAADPEAKARAVLFLALLDALGAPLGPSDWDGLVADVAPVAAEVPAAVVRVGLDASGRSGRVGETVLLATIASGGLPQDDAPLAAAVVRSLRAVGLAAEARAYAVECMIEAAG